MQFKMSKLHILGVFCSLRYPACNAHVPYYVVICGLPGCTFFPHYLLNGMIFEKKKNFKHKMCFVIFSRYLSETFPFLIIIERKSIKMYIGLHVKCLLFLSDFS
jgi:hypothetical protein